MMRATWAALCAAGIAAGMLSGCQSAAVTTRGQSPSGEVVPAGHHHTPLKAAKSELADCYHEHHNTSTQYYSAGGPGGHGAHGGQFCPPGAGSGYCPPGGAYGPYGATQCPPGGAYCPHGAGAGLCPHGCRHGGSGEAAWAPRHGYSYSYEKPNDLVYPPANSTGGTVVYPYYTHKGPSDFFRK